MEIVSLCLALEPKGFDRVVQEFAANAAFNYSGIDAVSHFGESRKKSRAGYDFFTAEAPEPARNTRRRLVVLNGLPSATGETLWAPLANRDYFRSPADLEKVRVAMDAVVPVVSTNATASLMSFASWADSHGLEDLEGDPDRDGVSNREEFFAGLDPHVANRGPRERPRLLRTPANTLQLRYPRATEARDVSAVLMVSEDLKQWRPYQGPAAEVEAVHEASEDWVLDLGVTDASYFRLEITVPQLEPSR